MFGKKNSLKDKGTSKLAGLTPPGSEPESPAEETAAEQAPVDETTPPAPAPKAESKPTKPSKPKQSTGIIRKAKKSAQPTSFRLTEDDKAKLQQIADRVNEESNGKISRDKVVQALIHMGEKMPPARILKALRDIL